MKKLLFLILLNLFCLKGHSQDPGLFQTWYLVATCPDLCEDWFLISDINPPISPYLTIDENYDFAGHLVCNTYWGNFILDPIYSTMYVGNLDHTDLICDYNNGFEDEYYYFLEDLTELNQASFGLINENTLLIKSMMGLQYLYTNTPILSIAQNYANRFVVYPSPAQDILTIDNTSSTQILQVKVFDLLGRLVIEKTEGLNTINVSGLDPGILFIQIETENGTITKKIIKT